VEAAFFRHPSHVSCAYQSRDLAFPAVATSKSSAFNSRSPKMFDSILSKITNTVRNVFRAVGAALNQSPWIVPVAILAALFFA
jgi:hypothetical protein